MQPKVCHYAHKSLEFDPIKKQINPFKALSPYAFKIHVNITFLT
jgi:hypothetical protein